MDDWQAISEENLLERLIEETSEFDEAHCRLWEIYQVPLSQVQIHRSDQSEIECVFVVGASGQYVLFFDDVEDEFCVGTLSRSGVVAECFLYGELRFALLGLAGHVAKRDGSEGDGLENVG